MPGIFDIPQGAGGYAPQQIQTQGVSPLNMSGGVGQIQAVDPVAAYTKAMQAKLLGIQVQAGQQGQDFRNIVHRQMMDPNGADPQGAGSNIYDAYWSNPGIRSWIDTQSPELSKQINEVTQKRIEEMRKTDPHGAQEMLAKTIGGISGIVPDRRNDPANWEKVTLADGTIAHLPKVPGMAATQEIIGEDGRATFAPIDMDKVMATAGAQIAKGEKLTPAMLGTLHQYAAKMSMEGDKTQADPNTGNVSKYSTAGSPLAAVHALIAKNNSLPTAAPGGAAPAPGVDSSGQRPGVTPGKIGTGQAPGKMAATSPGGVSGVQGQPNGTKSITSGGATIIQAPMGAADTKEADEVLTNSGRIHSSGQIVADNWDPSMFTATGKARIKLLQIKESVGMTLNPEDQKYLARYQALDAARGVEYMAAVKNLGGSRITESVRQATEPTLPNEVQGMAGLMSVSDSPTSAAAKFKSMQIYSAISGTQATASKHNISSKDLPADWANHQKQLSGIVDQKAAAYRQANPGMDPSTAVVRATVDTVREYHNAVAQKLRVPSIFTGR